MHERIGQLDIKQLSFRVLTSIRNWHSVLRDREDNPAFKLREYATQDNEYNSTYIQHGPSLMDTICLIFCHILSPKIHIARENSEKHALHQLKVTSLCLYTILEFLYTLIGSDLESTWRIRTEEYLYTSTEGCQSVVDCIFYGYMWGYNKEFLPTLTPAPVVKSTVIYITQCKVIVMHHSSISIYTW